MENLNDYEKVRGGSIGYIEMKRGLIEVSGKEAVQFLNGLITNDVAKLEDNSQMAAAFPNAQGRLLAVAQVARSDDKFLFETEEKTHAAIYNNLFRFTYAGDFFVEDLSENYRYFQITDSTLQIPNFDYFEFKNRFGTSVFVPNYAAAEFHDSLDKQNAVEISSELHELLRIERGIPLYGVDMDETTIVPEIGLPDVISYNKGCYIGQEIIARIHFRGHVAKQLTGLILSESAGSANDLNIAELKNTELKSPEGKNAGRITSAIYSPRSGKIIALAYVRYDYLTEGTEVKVNDLTAQVKNLPFVE